MQRRCIVTREVRPADELIRFVLDPDGRVVPDLARKLPGRGVWVTAEADLVDTAARRNLFARAFRTRAVVPEGLAEAVARGLRERALSLLSLANKAGALVLGFDKVKRLIAQGRAHVLISAGDAGADGAGKLEGAFRTAGGAAAGGRIVGCFTGAQLNLALGRPNVVHAALTNHGLAERFLDAARSYARYAGVPLVSRETIKAGPGADGGGR